MCLAQGHNTVTRVGLEPQPLDPESELLTARRERTGAVVKPRTLGLEIVGSSPPVAVRCGLEQVTYPQLLR